MDPSQLSRELRTGDSADLNRRRWMIGLTFVGMVAAKAVSLYQMGMIKKLPDPPLPVFDSTKVDASDYAYKRFNTPDGLMMLANFAATAWLVGAGGKNRAVRHPVLPVLLAGKAAGDALTAAKLTQEEWQENKALCAYCQVAMLCSIATAALAVPEAVRAVRFWQRKK
ncbi:MAG: hypothetical protein OHK0029_13160 [Armatimonadaceae bacterium]